MLKLYCYLEDLMEGRQLYSEPPFNHKIYLSNIMELLQIEDSSEMELAFDRALAVLKASGVAAGDHIRLVYQNIGHDNKQDISLSPLAAQLIIINSNTANKFVAKTQLFIMDNL